MTTPVAEAGARPYVLAWYACDLLSGAIIEELPSLTPTQALARRLGTYTTMSADLSLKGAPADWESATAQGRSMLVAVDTDTNTPLWAGLTLTRAGGSASTVQLGLVTPEAYLDRRFTGDVTLSQQDQASVVTALMAAPLSGGPPFVMDAPATGVLMDYSVLDSDDRTVLSSLADIMAMEGGPEWTIDVDWSDANHTGFVLPVRVRTAVGTQTSSPEGTFDYPGAVSSYVLTESYEQGKGATIVQARGDGEGASRVSSDPYTATDLIAAGWGRWVYRYSPSSGSDPVALNAHAAQALALMQTGATVWTIEATASRAPRLGADWSLGDSIRLAVESSPRHPNGTDTVARAWSWELEPGSDKIRPILVEDA
jgi:hypothetical protein